MLTPQQIFVAEILQKCTFPPATLKKRFIMQMPTRNPDFTLTPKQEKWLADLFYSFRRQHGLLPIIEW